MGRRGSDIWQCREMVNCPLPCVAADHKSKNNKARSQRREKHKEKCERYSLLTTFHVAKGSATHHYYSHRYCCYRCSRYCCILLDQELCAQSYCFVLAAQSLDRGSFRLGQEILSQLDRSRMGACSFRLDVCFHQEGFGGSRQTGLEV